MYDECYAYSCVYIIRLCYLSALAVTHSARCQKVEQNRTLCGPVMIAGDVDLLPEIRRALCECEGERIVESRLEAVAVSIHSSPI